MRRKSLLIQLLISTENDPSIIRDYAARILGEHFVPSEADHSEVVPAKAKYVKFDHNYFPSAKSKKMSSCVPSSNIISTLKRMGSKVEILPTKPQDVGKKPCFVGARPPARHVNRDLIMYVNGRNNNEIKPKVPKSCPINRSRIQIITIGKENQYPKENLDDYLRKEAAKNAPIIPISEVLPADVNLSEKEENFEPVEKFLTVKKNKRKIEATLEEIVVDPKTYSDTRKRSNVDEITSVSPKKMKLSPDIETNVVDKNILIEANILKNSEKAVSSSLNNSKSTECGSLEDAWKSIDEFLHSEAPESNTPSDDASVPIIKATLEPTNISQEENQESESNYETQLQKHLDNLREPIDEAKATTSVVETIPTNKEATVISNQIETNMITDISIQSSYSIKQEPIEFPQVGGPIMSTGANLDSYNIKLEPVQVNPSTSDMPSVVPPVNMKQELDVYGLMEAHQVSQVKLVAVKAEPIEYDDDGDIEMLTPMNESDANSSQELCDVVSNVLRCGECFASFSSKEDLTMHSKIHNAPNINDKVTSAIKFSSALFDDSEIHQWLSEKKAQDISSSLFPKIVLEKVSTVNHQYIFPSKELAKKAEKMTVLQALDSLFQPTTKKVEPKSTVVSKAPPKASNTSLNKDRGARGPAGVTCQVCHKVKCKNMETMRSHLTFHPHAQCVGKVNICYICDDKFDIRDTSFGNHVDQHLKEMKKSDSKQCEACNKKFSNNSDLLNHVMIIHEKQKCFPCSKCNEIFERRKKMLLHYDTLHGSSN